MMAAGDVSNTARAGSWRLRAKDLQRGKPGPTNRPTGPKAATTATRNDTSVTKQGPVDRPQPNRLPLPAATNRATTDRTTPGHGTTGRE